MAFFIAGAVVLVVLLLLVSGFSVADVGRLASRLRRSAGAALALVAIGLAATGRFPAAIGLGILAWGLLIGDSVRRRPSQSRAESRGPNPPPRRGAMSRAEAFEVLGLQPGASADEIRAAHRRLILQAHPDKGGSNYLAAKINEAKDVLLG
jgi:DnaJ homolog subfamily C member 19